MADYQHISNSDAVLRYSDQAHIPPDGGNRDWQAYQDYVAAGGVTDPPPPPSRAGVIAQSSQALALQQAQQLNAQGDTQGAVAAILDHLGSTT